MTAKNSRIDGQSTRAALLEAAGQLFAEQGFAHTTNKAVAEAAGADTASINYHFGSRDGLYQAVLIEAHRHFVSIETLENLYTPGQDALTVLTTFYQHFLPLVLGNGGWQMRLLAQAIIIPTPHLDVLDQQEILPKSAVMRKMVSTICGIDADSAEAEILTFAIVAPLLSLFLMNKRMPVLLENIFHQDIDETAAMLARYAVAGSEKVNNPC